MDPVESPHLAPLRAVADRVADAGALPPASLTAVRRRARHLRRRRQAGSGLAVLAVAGVGAAAVVGRPEPSEQVSFGVAPDVGPGGTAAPGTSAPATPPTPPPGAPAPAGVRIFMHPAATADQIDHVRVLLETETGMRLLAFKDRQDAYAEFRELFRDSPEMIDSVRPEVLPTSFAVDAGDDARAEVLAAKARTWAGVREVAVLDPPARAAEVRRHLSELVLGR